MSALSLSQGLVPKGSTRIFTDSSLPAALLDEHSLRANRWSVLHVYSGSVEFHDIESDETCALAAPDLNVIAPLALHKLRLVGPVTCRIDFFEVPNTTDTPRESGAHQTPVDDPVRLSFARCESSADFAERFYDTFLKSSPEIAPYFAATDFAKQRKLLRAAIYIVVTGDITDSVARETLERIGKSHSRSKLGIEPRLYEFWLDSVAATVKASDSEWTEKLDAQWRDRLRLGIQIITAAF